MSEQTGATDAQIEAAFTRIAGPDHDPAYDPESDWFVRDELRRYARDLVPPDYRIVPASDVLNDELKAAIGWALAVVDEVIVDASEWASECVSETLRYHPTTDGGYDQHLALLRQAAGVPS